MTCFVRTCLRPSGSSLRKMRNGGFQWSRIACSRLLAGDFRSCPRSCSCIPATHTPIASISTTRLCWVRFCTAVDLGDRASLQGLITEVRYAAGICSVHLRYSDEPVHSHTTACCEPTLLRFTVTGHSLEETWGAINSSNNMWADVGNNPVSGPTNTVVSMTPVHNGFLVVPERNGSCCLHRGLHAVASPAIGPRDSHLH